MRTIVLTLLCVLSTMVLSCSRQTVPEATSAIIARLDPATDINVGELSVRSQRLPRVVAIPEAEFIRLLSYNTYGAPNRSDVGDTLQLAASANSSDALGITGSIKTHLGVSADDLLIVMENPTSTAQGLYQSTRYHFAAVRLEGTSDYGFVDVDLHFNSGEPQSLCGTAWRGCRPSGSSASTLLWAHSSEGGAGLPADTLFDAEINESPHGFAGHSVELRVFSGSDLELPVSNRFVCAGETSTLGCEDLPGQPVSELANSFSDVGTSAAVVSEHTLETWMRRGEIKFKEPSFGKEAAIVGAQLNHPAALGIVSELAEGALTVDVLIVVRNPYTDFDQRRFEGRNVYVVPGPLALPPGIVGLNPRIGFIGTIPSGPWTGGVCGPVLTPGPGFSPSWLGAYAYNPIQANYGTNRFALGRPRSSVRIPFMFNGSLEVHKIACSIYEPPTPPPQPTCMPQLLQEDCNGVDDNCNGQIDEPSPLDPCSVPQCETCTPASCGQTRCASLPDGCGQMIVCPCP